MDGINVLALQQLLGLQKEDSDSSDDDLPKSNTAKLGKELAAWVNHGKYISLH
jgi:hypothetical protein